MLRMMSCLMLSLILAGCESEPTVRISAPGIESAPDFCALTDHRVFTEAVARWRIANDRENLIKDVNQNELRKELCG